MNFKVYLFLFCSFLFSTVLFSETYHTIAINGTNDGWTAEETFTNISHDGNAEPRYAYFTWDADYIYIGIAEVEADYDKLATFFYFDTDPTGSNGTSNAYAWTDYMGVPFNADFVVVMKNEIWGSDYIEVRQYNGVDTWNQIYSADDESLVVGSDTLAQIVVTGGNFYREFRIKRSLLGNPEAIKTCMFTEQQWGSNWRYFTWPSDGWTDKNRGFGQSIPNYYGFVLNEDITPYSLPYYNASFTAFTGIESSTWSTAGNWTNGVPNDNSLVIVPGGSSLAVGSAEQSAYLLQLGSTAALSLQQGGELTVKGNFYNPSGAAGVNIASTATGNGSFIVEGNYTGEITVGYYVTAAQWHSFAAPVANLTTMDLFLNHSPEVWIKEHSESTNQYFYISSTTEPLGDGKGWMLWLGGNDPHTYAFEGQMRTVVGTTDNLVRSATGEEHGWNFAGNPYPSAIDWDAADGWTKTNVNNAVYVYHKTDESNIWATYIAGVSVNGGSRYIPMNQGFFVEVADGDPFSASGTLMMNRLVCVHNDVPYYKNADSITDPLIRLVLSSENQTDEAVVRFSEQATIDFDGQLDAHKMFGMLKEAPVVFFTDNGGMCVNSLPMGVESIPLDVKGEQGAAMILSMTDDAGFDHVYLTDNHSGVTADLKEEPYTFDYLAWVDNRFTLHFSLTGAVDHRAQADSFLIFAQQGAVVIQNPEGLQADVVIYNVAGQKMVSSRFDENTQVLPVSQPGAYLVVVTSATKTTTKTIILN